MTKFYNMKIEINDQQPLDEVEKVCKEKDFSHELADTVFALTYARLNK